MKHLIFVTSILFPTLGSLSKSPEIHNPYTPNQKPYVLNPCSFKINTDPIKNSTDPIKSSIDPIEIPIKDQMKIFARRDYDCMDFETLPQYHNLFINLILH